MSRRPLIDTVQMSLQVPRGIDGIWSAIRLLDKAGSWTINDAAKHCKVHKRTMNEFVRGLEAGGFAQRVGENRQADHAPVQPAALYRLVRQPQATPRLARDGSALPETAPDILWRSMKIAKVFTATELAELASVKLSTTRAYLRALAQAGVVVGAEGKEHFRLVLNLGARAPTIVSAHIVFDPNATAIVGQPLASEVKL